MTKKNLVLEIVNIIIYNLLRLNLTDDIFKVSILRMETENNHLSYRLQIICGKCGSDNVVCNGTSKIGRQRYLCKDCGKTFTETTGVLIAHSHQSVDIWESVIHDACEGITSSASARKNNLSCDTVLKMRKKIYALLKTAKSADELTLDGFNPIRCEEFKKAYMSGNIPLGLINLENMKKIRN